MPFAHCGEKQHGRSLRLPNLTRLAAWHSFLSRRQKRQRVRRRVGTASLGEVRRVRFSRQEWDFSFRSYRKTRWTHGGLFNKHGRLNRFPKMAVALQIDRVLSQTSATIRQT